MGDKRISKKIPIKNENNLISKKIKMESIDKPNENELQKVINNNDYIDLTEVSTTLLNLKSIHHEIKIEDCSESDYDLGSEHNGTFIENSISEQTSTETSTTDDDVIIIENEPENNSSEALNGSISYPQLQVNFITLEEQRLLAQEGIRLQTNYPLTKHAEYVLKRIRRKIRNRISAQDARKKKKEYVNGLEDRLRQCIEENQNLLKHIKILQTQNQTLVSKLRSLEALMSRKVINSGSTTDSSNVNKQEALNGQA